MVTVELPELPAATVTLMALNLKDFACTVRDSEPLEDA